jgi:exonuclease III
VYRFPDGAFSIFLQNLESVIQETKVKKRWLILCGDWNINFMEESKRMRDIQALLILYNLVNTVRSPTSHKNFGFPNRCCHYRQGDH